MSKKKNKAITKNLDTGNSGYGNKIPTSYDIGPEGQAKMAALHNMINAPKKAKGKK